MKKAYKIINKKINIFFLGFVCFFVFNFTACGLESYVVVDAPVHVVNKPDYSNNYDNRYFEFNTNEKNSSYPSDFVFLGTDIYYKIYSSYSTMTSETSALESLSVGNSNNSNVAERMIDSYKYKALKIKNYYSSPLIPASSISENQRVYVRLSSYLDSSSFAARVLLDGKNIGVPFRNSSSELSFDFGRTDQNKNINKIPLSSDDDVSYSSVSEEGKWYIAMFAVASGRDVTYTTYYSNILYLGNVSIDSNSFDN